MPKDPSKNIDRYKIRGGTLNEFEFTENQEAFTEDKSQKSANLIPGTPPEERQRPQVAAKKVAGKKSATKTAKKSAKRTQKSATKSTKKSAKSAKKGAKTTKKSSKGTKKGAKSTKTKPVATRGASAKKLAARKAAKK